MSKHTPEPWIVTNNTDIFPIGDTKARRHIADCDTSNAPLQNDGLNDMTDLDYDEVMANAHRIVATINACEGIPTEALESGFMVAEALKEGEFDNTAMTCKLATERLRELEAEVERLKDCERIAWALARKTNNEIHPYIWTRRISKGTASRRWELVTDRCREIPLGPTDKLPTLTDEARLIIDAAMAKEKDNANT